MAVFADLASETAERILLLVDDRNTLYNCLLVCKWLHQVARRVFYREVTFVNDDYSDNKDEIPAMFSFPLHFFSHPKNSTLRHRVQSLVIHGRPPVTGRVDRYYHDPWPIVNLSHLLHFLQYFPNLQCFELSSFVWNSHSAPILPPASALLNIQQIEFHHFSAPSCTPTSLVSIASYVRNPFTFIIGNGEIFQHDTLSPLHPVAFLPPLSALVCYDIEGVHPTALLGSCAEEDSAKSPLQHLAVGDLECLLLASDPLVKTLTASQHTLTSLAISFMSTRSSHHGKFLLYVCCLTLTS